MIPTKVGSWHPNLDEGLRVLLPEWYLKVKEIYPNLDYTFGSLYTSDEKYNIVMFTTDVIFEVRLPYEDLDNYPGREWHEDGLDYLYTVMWTNKEPTLTREKGIDNIDDIVSFNDDDIFVIDNRTHYHRAPDVRNRNRFYARALVYKELYGT